MREDNTAEKFLILNMVRGSRIFSKGAAARQNKVLKVWKTNNPNQRANWSFSVEKKDLSTEPALFSLSKPCFMRILLFMKLQSTGFDPGKNPADRKLSWKITGKRQINLWYSSICQPVINWISINSKLKYWSPNTSWRSKDMKMQHTVPIYVNGQNFLISKKTKTTFAYYTSSFCKIK